MCLRGLSQDQDGRAARAHLTWLGCVIQCRHRMIWIQKNRALIFAGVDGYSYLQKCNFLWRLEPTKQIFYSLPFYVLSFYSLL